MNNKFLKEALRIVAIATLITAAEFIMKAVFNISATFPYLITGFILCETVHIINEILQTDKADA